VIPGLVLAWTRGLGRERAGHSPSRSSRIEQTLSEMRDDTVDPVLRIVGVSCVVRTTGDPAASRWSCQPACRRRCLQHQIGFSTASASHVTRIANRLLALGELRGNRDLLPGRDDRTAVAVGTLRRLDRSLSTRLGRRASSSRRWNRWVGQVEQAAEPARRGGRTSSTTCSRSVRKRSTASLDGGRSKPQLRPDDRVLEFSRDWTDAVDVLVVAVQERSEECWW